MTVVTTVFPASVPFSIMSLAHMTRMWSPSMTSPFSSTHRQRSASPSCAMPMSAPSASTVFCSDSRCVEPQASLMLTPSGSAWITCTSAPRRRRTRGMQSYAAPFAQSSTTFKPSSCTPAVPCTKSMYSRTYSLRRLMRPMFSRVARGSFSPASMRRTRLSISSSTASGSL